MNNWKKLTLALILFSSNTFSAQEVDKVAAVVNNGVVLQSEVNSLLRSVKLNAEQNRQSLPDEATLHRQILERLIMDTIQLEIAKKMGVLIDDKELDKAIANIAEQNRMTPAELQQRLTAEGINNSAYRAQIRKDMTIAEARNSEVRRRVTILPTEVAALAKQLATQPGEDTEFNISHILLPLPENPDQEQITNTAKLAEQLVSRLNKGEDFGQLAITYSADPQALNGGQMGWGKLGEIPGLFAQPLQNSKVGDIVGPIRSGVGFHILRVNDIRGSQQEISVTEVHARHILVRPSLVVTDEQARNKLETLKRQLNNGADFAKLAKEHSEDPGSTNRGGDLGWTSPDIFDPAFRDALSKLDKGEVSKPVHSSFGWHLIQLLDKRKVDKTDAALKERAYRMLFNRKFAEETQVWMQEERASAYVKILDNHDNTKK